MDFGFDKKIEEFRSALREFLRENFPEELAARRFERPLDWEFNKKIARWREENLRGRDPFEVVAFSEEAESAGVTLDINNPTMHIAQTLSVVGTEEQKREFVPRMLAGELLFCVGYSEPDSGSDIAAAKTRAVRDGDEWVINGQKMFTSHAYLGTHVFLLTRTNTEVSKHQGLTLFIVPLDSPGVEVRLVRTLVPHSTTTTFYTDVRVPDTLRVGDVDGGWSVIKVGLSFERASNHSLMSHLCEHAVRRARSAVNSDGSRVIDDPVVRERLARMAIDDEVSRLLSYRTTWTVTQGEIPGTEANVSKLFGTEAYLRHALEMTDLVGADGVLNHGQDDAPGEGWINFSLRDAPVHTIAGGSSEVQRDIIAERRLGLPRTRPRG